MSRFFAAAAAFASTIAANELDKAVPYVKAALDEFPGDLRSADPVTAALATASNAYAKMKADPGITPSLTSIMGLTMSAAMNGFSAYMGAKDEETAAAAPAKPAPAPAKPSSTTAALLAAVPPPGTPIHPAKPAPGWTPPAAKPAQTAPKTD